MKTLKIKDETHHRLKIYAATIQVNIEDVADEMLVKMLDKKEKANK